MRLERIQILRGGAQHLRQQLPAFLISGQRGGENARRTRDQRGELPPSCDTCHFPSPDGNLVAYTCCMPDSPET